MPLIHKSAFLLVLLLVAAPAFAQDKSVVLFDFEQGIAGWGGNPWGGGKCQVQPATSAKYGSGALHGSYTEVKKGASVVGPYFSEDAAWRKQSWGAISFWLKGDGSPGRLALHLETAQPGSTGFTAQIPLEQTDWTRHEIARFWSREGLTPDFPRLKRIYFACKGTHSFDVDQIALQAPHREVPLDYEKPSAARVPLLYFFNEYSFGDYGVVLDASPVSQKDIEVRVSLADAEGRVFAGNAKVTPQAARAGEVFIPVRADFKEKGVAEFSLTVLSDGDVLSTHAGRFAVFLPPKPRPKDFISLLPTPKKLTRGNGEFILPHDAMVRCVGLEPEDRERCLGLLGAELKQYYGVNPRESSSEAAVISLLRAESSAALSGSLPKDVLQEFDRLPAEGYVLHVAPSQATVAAKDPRGIFYGIQTLLEATAYTTVVPAEPKAPAMTVIDYPTLRVRAASMSIPCNRWGHPNDAYVSPEFFCDFLARTLVRWKYNTLILIVGNGMKFDRHPECSGPAAWSKDEVRRVLEFCRRNYIEVVPLQTVLAHANWFTLAHKDLWEDGEYHIACVSNPATQELLREVYDEIVGVFQPKFMHLGMDEAWWKTLDVPPEQRCKLCGGKSKWQIVADQAKRFRDYLASKGIRAMMWGDMLLNEHNGGAPYHSAKALDTIPRDIIICNWSTSLAPASSKRFRNDGHEVIQSNSMGVNQEQAEWVIGNMMGVWTKNPWLTNSYFRGAQSYSFLSLVQAAELSWNVDEDITRETWRLRREIIEAVEQTALRQLAMRPEPAASGEQRSIAISALYNLSTAAGVPPTRERWFGLTPQEDLRGLPASVSLAGVTFNVLPAKGQLNAIAFSEKPVTIPVNERVASLYFLQGCHLDEKDREAFLKRFQKKEAMTGVLLGAYRIRYGDGSETTMDIRYAWNVMPWRAPEGAVGAPPIPYCYASPAVFTFATQGMKSDPQLYVAQWANEHPEKPVASIVLSSAGTEATPFLLAVTAKLAR